VSDRPSFDQRPREAPATATGPGRVLITVYGIFTVAAGARSAFQLATRFDQAPLAYTLSAVAALIYLVATVALAVSTRRSRRIAAASCVIELAGVIAVGTYSLLDPSRFPDQTVWSGYGQGYGFVPLALPMVGLLWLRRSTARTRTGS
jgi:hypothetical protein